MQEVSVDSRSSYKNVIVKKPWGYEYLMYENSSVALWCLHINHGARTSLHCHPHKKTGLILLSGEARVSFLNDSMPLKALGKLMIRQGLFHSTEAVVAEGISVIEVETPRDKEDLVRLDDAYGREEKPYEGSDSMIPLSSDCIQLSHPEENSQLNYQLSGCNLTLERFKDAAGLRGRPPADVIVILDGGLFSKTGEPVLGPGDVVSTSTLDRLAETFAAPHGGTLLSIRKDVSAVLGLDTHTV